MKSEAEAREEIRKEVAKMQGFKQAEFEDCLLCGKGMAHNQDLDFYRIKIERFFLDYGNIQMQHGLEMSVGGAASLAAIMGPDRDLAKEPSPHPTFLICGTCGLEKSLPLALMSEKLVKREEED